MASILQGKKLAVMGDSLIYGNKLGNAVTWPNLLGEKHNMTVYNFGINGNPIACQTRYPEKVSMCVRYKDMPDDADYVVILGGANDRNCRVPIGENEDTDLFTFKGALNHLIAGLLQKYPRAKILFMTNYDRYPKPNEMGMADIEYVEAMLEMCAKWGIPCFDNFHDSGVDFQSPESLAWMDEGVELGGEPNRHFSRKGYQYLLPIYEKLLENL